MHAASGLTSEEQWRMQKRILVVDGKEKWDSRSIFF